jgi:hypothetical protein
VGNYQGGLAAHVVGTIQEDLDEDNYDYYESEMAAVKARTKKKLLPNLINSSEGSGSQGTFGPEA